MSKNDAAQLQIILDVNQQSKLHWETQRGQANYSGKEFWLLTFESSSERGLQDETLSASKTFLVVVFTVEVTRWSVSCLLLRPCLHPSLAAGPPIITHQIDVSIRQTNTARSIAQGSHRRSHRSGPRQISLYCQPSHCPFICLIFHPSIQEPQPFHQDTNILEIL